MYFIQETDKPKLLYKLFLIPKLERDEILVPINNIKEDKKKVEKEIEKNNKKEIKLAQRTKKILDKTHCKKIILSKELQKYKIFSNQLYTYGFEIINGKWLFNVLSCEILEYIVKKEKMTEEKVKISILVNDVTDIELYNIKEIVKKYKRLNIVTNHIEKFKKLEEQILDEYGLMITLTNNKKKSLTKTDIILNVDFPTELINKYRIAENAIIINLKQKTTIKQKRFEGKIFNDYEILHQNIEEIEYDKNKKFHIKDIYEALIYKQQPIENIRRKVEKDKVEIKFLK